MSSERFWQKLTAKRQRVQGAQRTHLNSASTAPTLTTQNTGCQSIMTQLMMGNRNHPICCSLWCWCNRLITRTQMRRRKQIKAWSILLLVFCWLPSKGNTSLSNVCIRTNTIQRCAPYTNITWNMLLDALLFQVKRNPCSNFIFYRRDVFLSRSFQNQMCFIHTFSWTF